MRGRRAFRLAGVLALLGMVASVTAAVLTGAVGVAALTGRIGYPYAVEVGPIHAQWRMTLPVAGSGDICQRASVSDQGPAACYRFFLHQSADAGSRQARRQDADVRPSEVELRGQAELVTVPGWSPYVAAVVLHEVITMLGLAVLSYLLWRILWAAAAGDAFTRPTVRRLRLMAVLVLAGALVGPVLNGLARIDVLGYWSESFGVYPELQPRSDLALSGSQIAVALVLFLVVEVFRHGAVLEDEARATV
ncbi:hypothetical protein [uncultured Friedmanniella sp.]|uniref:hypothetical protein n=1 Tax=uncultured Friedmanniella sp. TaxID=335381 RepID=UPI0035C9B3F4